MTHTVDTRITNAMTLDWRTGTDCGDPGPFPNGRITGERNTTVGSVIRFRFAAYRLVSANDSDRKPVKMSSVRLSVLRVFLVCVSIHFTEFT